MRKLICLLGFVVFFSLSAYAQDTPKVELFGGYSYARNSSGFIDTFNGFNISVTRNVSRYLGATAEFGGLFSRKEFIFGAMICNADGTNCVPFSTDNRTSDNLFTFLTGPKLSLRKSSRVTPFVQSLLGAYRIKAISATVPEPPLPEFTSTESNFAAALGGGLDLNVRKNIAVRAIQADYLYLRDINRTSKNNLRLSFGLVFRFGGI